MPFNSMQDCKTEALRIQSNVRSWLVRRHFRQLREATRTVQAAIRRTLARRRGGEGEDTRASSSLRPMSAMHPDVPPADSAAASAGYNQHDPSPTHAHHAPPLPGQLLLPSGSLRSLGASAPSLRDLLPIIPEDSAGELPSSSTVYVRRMPLNLTEQATSVVVSASCSAPVSSASITGGCRSPAASMPAWEPSVEGDSGDDDMGSGIALGFPSVSPTRLPAAHQPFSIGCGRADSAVLTELSAALPSVHVTPVSLAAAPLPERTSTAAESDAHGTSQVSSADAQSPCVLLHPRQHVRDGIANAAALRSLERSRRQAEAAAVIARSLRRWVSEAGVGDRRL